MLTVKLMRGDVTKVLEAQMIDIYPAGKAQGSDVDPSKRTNLVREISITGPHLNGNMVFYVSDEKDASKLDLQPADVWDIAYIENSQGKTTETIRAY
jgi:hypothetical protein